MPSALTFFNRIRLAALAGDRYRLGIGVLALLHLAALAVLLRTEDDFVPGLVFVLTWGLLNFVWLLLLRRPAVAASLSLIMIVALILLSQFKQDILIMSANFVDVLLIDADTFSFLLTIFPGLAAKVGAVAGLALPLLVLFWWLDPFRVRLRIAALGAVACLAALSALSLAVSMDREKAFESSDYVSQFARSGSLALYDLATRGFLESDSSARDRLPSAGPAACKPEQRLPHIVLVLDESSYDITAAPGVKVPPGYRSHFRSFDGKERTFLVEGAGGPTWFTEYNVLSGLSVRSYGHFAEFVTRIAAGRVTRSLPNALRDCGYRTYSIYPWLGAFLSARNFQKTLGIDHFYDAKDLKTRDVEPDEFYYAFAADLLKRNHAHGPMFVFTYLMANHFPWTNRYRDELSLDWRDLGNADIKGNRVDEYLRRQHMSAHDYKAFVERLKREFPGERFLIVRFGDHQPAFAKYAVDPSLDDAAIGRRIDAADPRFFSTYYAIDALNFRPTDLSSAINGLDAAYLPLVILQAAGVPLDSSFAEQKRIFQRCNGLFYLSASGAEARRFNRLLIDAGMIKRL
jgi:phosphoglycerol transferase MdoB-like AlkP superfamily enzyme